MASKNVLSLFERKNPNKILKKSRQIKILCSELTLMNSKEFSEFSGPIIVREILGVVEDNFFYFVSCLFLRQ